MNQEREALAETFGQLDSEELLARYRSGRLTELAKQVASEELQRRGVAVPVLIENNEDPDQDEVSGRDLLTAAMYYIPTDAFIVQGCLVAAGIPAVLADENLVQTNSLLTPALGGVRILVPENYLQQAHDVIEAFNRGEFGLDDDTDVGTTSA
ncbi:hypothetical protein BH11PSE11_BH11PSE11_28250 [soil metagenome]